MSIVLSPGLVIAPATTFQPHWPVIAWDNLVTIENVEAEFEDADHPATNLANPSTNLRWQSTSTADQTLLVTLSTTKPVDCLGVARHNFGSAGIPVSVDGLTAEPGAVWEEIFPEYLPADDTPLLLRYASTNLIGVRLNLQPGAVAPRAAVLHVSKSLLVPRGVQPGYTPIVDGQDVDLLIGRAVSGDLLGSIVTGEALSSTASFVDLDPTFYDTEMRPYVSAANRGRAFFFGWSPTSKPKEVGYCSLLGAARPVINQTTGEKDIQLAMGGVAI